MVTHAGTRRTLGRARWTPGACRPGVCSVCLDRACLVLPRKQRRLCRHRRPTRAWKLISAWHVLCPFARTLVACEAVSSLNESLL